jgi:hypothetical protein
MPDRTVHYDWLADLERGATLAQVNFADKTILPATVDAAGQMSTRLFQDSAAALNTHHPAIADRLLGIGNRLHDIVISATTPAAATSAQPGVVPAPVKLAPVTPTTVRLSGVKQSNKYDL